MAFLHDLLWILAAIWLAFWLRFNLGEIPSTYLSALHLLIMVALPVQTAFFWYFGLYRGIWRFASLPDLLRILQSVLLGVLATFIIVFVWQRLEGMPRSVLFLYPLILILGLAAPRLFYRWLKDRHLHFRVTGQQRALLVGAGQAGELLVRDLLKSGPYEPVGFLDDADRRQGQEIQGVRVIGRLSDMERVIADMAVNVVLLAIPSASHQVIQAVASRCQQAQGQAYKLRVRPILYTFKSRPSQSNRPGLVKSRH